MMILNMDLPFAVLKIKNRITLLKPTHSNNYYLIMIMKYYNIIFMIFFFTMLCPSNGWSQEKTVNRSGKQITLTKSSVNLSQVDNTSDIEKPVSSPTQTALNLKENIADLSTDIFADGLSDSKYPSAKATRDYINTVTWKINGNANTLPGTHFIGTTDNSDIIFKMMNTEVFRINSSGNVGINQPATIDAKLTINSGLVLNISGNPLNMNKILTSDANGLGSWVELPSPDVSIQPTPRPTKVSYVVSSTGRIWMDRNLGASRRAQSYDDYYAYGKLFQWGRADDGHADMNWISSTSGNLTNGTTTTLSTTDYPGHNLFIINNMTIDFWQLGFNSSTTTLWQGLNGINNPCPANYRIPTQAEWAAEVAAYNITDGVSAFNSVLKLTLPGNIDYNSGLLQNSKTNGFYWTSSTSFSPSEGNVRKFFETNTGINPNSSNFSKTGFSVRCIKD